MILDAIGDIDIGRWFSGLVELSDLKTGVMFAIFQTEGTADVLIDKLIMYTRGPAIISAQYLSRPVDVRQYWELSARLEPWVLLERIF